MANPPSILNEEYQILNGPQLLHKLIGWQRDACVLDFLGAHGQRQKYSYKDLRKCILSATGILREALVPVKSNTQVDHQIVPILLPQSPSLYIAILAILEADAAFCPINLDAPADRIKFVIRDVSARVVITTRGYEHLVIYEGGPKVILLEEYPPVPNGDNNRQILPSPTARPRDLAYVMYTSGSSGTPKGVAVSHLAASQSLLAHEKFIPKFSRFLQFAAPSFDVSVFEIFFPLRRGATLVGCSRAQMLNDLTGVIMKLDVDAAELTPTVVSSLIQKRSNVPSLNLLLTIGEMLTKRVVDEFGSSEGKEGILYAMYGPTEAAIHCTINPRMKSDARHTDIGIPFDTVSTFVVASESPSGAEKDIKILPLGEVGELVLGGPQLADGYLNRPEQNQKSFITVRGQRAYRTGDKALMTSNGTIEILGRMSSGQVKLRGQRAELGEIEEAVYKHPGIKTVAANVIGGILIAFVLTENVTTTMEDVLKTCSSWLPAFMVPSEIVILNTFPYLSSGKVDKRKLEEDFQAGRGTQNESMETWDTKTEKLVAQLVQEILGLKVGPTARLAAFGLDSLAAIRLASALRTSGFDVSTVEILKADNVRSLAQTCATRPDFQKPAAVKYVHKSELGIVNQQSFDISQEPVNFDEIDYILPCTPLQDAMITETSIDCVAYKNRIILELPMTSDLKHSQAAIQKLAEKNPVLRTGFIPMPNRHSSYLQVVWRKLSLSQFELVEDFSPGIGSPQCVTLLHPLYIHIRHYEGRIQLLMSIHHALYDAWSLELLLDDLQKILSSKAVLDRPPFINVLEHHFHSVTSENLWSSREYWKDHLSQLDILRMPNFHSFTNVKPGLKVNILQTMLATKELVSTAKALCVSPQAIFQAAFALILSSYLGSQDICFGTVFSGRTTPIPGIEEIVGPCLATLPIRIDLTTVSNMTDAVQRLNSTNRKHLEHSSLPLREIKKSCGIDPGRSLFDTLLVWQQTLHEVNYTREHVKLVDSTDYLEFNLTLEITPGPKNIALKANYQEAVFPSQQIDLLLRQLEELVTVIIKKPDIATNMAQKSFSEGLLSIENPLPWDDQLPGNLMVSVETIALNDPSRPAIKFANSVRPNNPSVLTITYSELNGRANKIAHHLLSICVIPDELVCICMEKSAELYISILATLKAGAGYLPITPDTPVERIQHILSEAKVRVILTHSSMSQHLALTSSLSIVLVDRLDFPQLSLENLPSLSNPDSLAYCVFTSGSTGMPKGVLVTQGNLMSNLQALAELYPCSSNSKLLQSCSQAFDVSVFEIFFTWHIGACLCSAVKDVLFNDIELAIRTLGVTHLSLTPTVAALVDPRNVPVVEFLVTAGEAVTEKVFNVWADHGLWQGYGPSETTNICTVRPDMTRDHSINNIGLPLKNTSVFVLNADDEFSLIPRGGEGEFCFGGAQVGRGYLNSAQGVGKFINHPTYGRLYRSGDYGRLLSDGSLTFTGRKDDQVKIRGQRIELGEINNVLLRSFDVLDCVTLVVDGESQADQRLVSFWSPHQSSTSHFTGIVPDPSVIENLVASVSATLPTYMVPSAFLPVSCLPSTTQGKIDKRRLISYYKSLSVADLNQASRTQKLTTDYAWNPIESDIASTVAKVANVPITEVGPDTSFFSLGIDSVSAISLSRALRGDIGVDVEISDILKYSSVLRLAKRASQTDKIVKISSNLISDTFDFDAKFVSETRDTFAKNGSEVERIMPCTPLQEAMLSASETSTTSAYSNQTILELIVGVREFEKAWTQMICRHEILRTCFVPTNHSRYAYAQVVLHEFSSTWDVKEVHSGGAVLINEIEPPVTNSSEQTPPYQLTFIKSTAKTKLVLSMHHALYDALAISTLFKEIEMTLHDELLPTPVSFSPFLQYINSTDLGAVDKYWQDLLRGFCPVYLPQKMTSTVNTTGKSYITQLYAEAELGWIEEQVQLLGSSC